MTQSLGNTAYVWTGATPAGTSTVNGLNQLLTGPGGPFAYDARGNLTGSGTKSFAYDAYNRLTGMNGTPVTQSGSQILGAVLAALAIFERLLGALLTAVAISGFTGLLTRDEQ